MRSEWWLRATELDGRSLRAVRVLLGLAMLYQQGRDFLLADTFFSGVGVAPSSVVGAVRLWSDFFSLHRLSEDTSVQRLLFSVGAAVALALIAGYKTRVMIVLAWYLTASAHARNPLLLQVGDTQLRMMLFFLIFLPWDRVRSAPVRSWANGFLLVQVAFSFWFAAALKTGTDWQHGTAVFYMLHSSSFATPLAEALLQSPRRVLLFLTWLSPWFEALLPFLFFAGKWGRGVAAAMIIISALALGLLFDLDSAALVSIAAAVLLLPDSFWTWTRARFGKSDPTPKAAGAAPAWTWASSAALVFCGLSLWANAVTVSAGFQELNVRPLRLLIGGVGFAQKWVFFQNVNRKDFGYYRIVAAPPPSAAGAEPSAVWSLFEQTSISLDAGPERGRDLYPSREWRRLTTSLLRETRGPIGFLGPGLCRELGDKATGHVQLWQYHRRLKFGLPADFYQRRLLLDYSCPDHKVVFDLRVDRPDDAGPFPQDGAT